MQCVSCQFENMPGSDVCGRCGTSLGLAAVAVEVHPPRAGRWSKRVRRIAPGIPVRSPVTRVLHRLAAVANARLKLRLSDSTPAIPLLLRCPVPGWPQLYVRNRGLGRFFLYTWLFLLACWVLFFYGTTFGSILLGLAFSTHSSSVADAINRVLEPTSVRRRMAYAICTSALLFGFVYLPAGRLLFAVADPMVLQADAFPFRAGDVVLVNHAALRGRPPRPGQLVLFTPPEYVVAGKHMYTHYTGPRIDRVLAVPGDRVVWARNRMTVNGRPSTVLPLNPGALPPEFDVTVPGGRYLILPTGTPRIVNKLDLLGMGLIEVGDVNGVVYFQVQPRYRIGVVR